MARGAGARKVYFASASPPVRYPNVYGIDMPTSSELVAHGRSVEDLQKMLGADRLIYQDLEDLIEAVRAGNPNITRFDCSVFNGEYITQDVTTEYLHQQNGLSSCRERVCRYVLLSLLPVPLKKNTI